MTVEQIKALDEQYYMHTFGARFPVSFTHGEGCTLYDTNGKSYTDFLAGIATNAFGYANPAIVKTISEQAAKLTHCSSLFYIEPQAELAQLLVENSCADRAFFANSGAEANEGAIKLARRFFSSKGIDRYEIITMQNSFHGRTLATLAATGQEKYQKPFRPMPGGFVHAEYNDLADVKAKITDKTAAIMCETVQGEGGVMPATPEFLQGLRQLCDANGILLIFDEVQTGLGRTGTLFGYQVSGVEPDILTLAKALGGGLPMGAVLAKEPAASAFQPGDHGTTMGGNPLCCATAITVVQMLLDGQVEKGAQTGAYFKQKLEALKGQFGFIKDVRGQGLMLGMELDADVPGKEIVAKALEKGFIINCAGHNTLRFVPPLIITQADIDALCDVLSAIFKDI
ncbi:Acetylornithine aminotransferase [uncultured Clostridium sp.]|nr:Acetylornithine aminotransferase [uncultured Clostridium sp.]